MIKQPNYIKKDCNFQARSLHLETGALTLLVVILDYGSKDASGSHRDIRAFSSCNLIVSLFRQNKINSGNTKL